MQSNNHVEKIEEYIYKCILKDELNDDDLVQIIERINTYLNLKTIQQYANDNNLSYNGAKKHRERVELFGCKFIKDNE